MPRDRIRSGVFVFGSASVIWSLSRPPLTDIHFVSAGMMSWQTGRRSPPACAGGGRDDERCFRQTARYTDMCHVASCLSSRGGAGGGGAKPLKAWSLCNLPQILHRDCTAITPAGLRWKGGDGRWAGGGGSCLAFLQQMWGPSQLKAHQPVLPEGRKPIMFLFPTVIIWLYDVIWDKPLETTGSVITCRLGYCPWPLNALKRI